MLGGERGACGKQGPCCGRGPRGPARGCHTLAGQQELLSVAQAERAPGVSVQSASMEYPWKSAVSSENPRRGGFKAYLFCVSSAVQYTWKLFLLSAQNSTCLGTSPLLVHGLGSKQRRIHCGLGHLAPKQVT